VLFILETALIVINENILVLFGLIVIEFIRTIFMLAMVVTLKKIPE
jgi:hypothetical protein